MSLALQHSELSSAADFACALLTESRAAGLLIPPGSIDHLCFRVATAMEYQSACAMIANGRIAGLKGHLLSESMVNGRPISAFKLETPVLFDDQNVWVIEIPSPKPGKPYQTGYEHFEVVTDREFADIRAAHPSLSFEVTPGGSPDNPELIWQSKSGAVKFHHQTLESVIERETTGINLKT